MYTCSYLRRPKKSRKNSRPKPIDQVTYLSEDVFSIIKEKDRSRT